MSETTGVARLPWQVRRYRRFKLSYPVHLLFRFGEQTSEVEAVTRDVCIGGLLLESPARIPQQSTVNFVISLQMPTLRPVELVGEGTVLRVEAARFPGKFAVALECGRPITEIEAYFPTDLN
jgi:PilZ domain